MKKLKKNMQKAKPAKNQRENVERESYFKVEVLEGYKRIKDNKDTLVNDYLTEAENLFKYAYEKSKIKQDETVKVFLEFSEEISKFKKEVEGKNIFDIKAIIENSIFYTYGIDNYMYILLNELLLLIKIKIGLFEDDRINYTISKLYDSFKEVYNKDIMSTNILKLFFVFLLPFEELKKLFIYYIVKNENVDDYDSEVIKFILTDKLYLSKRP